MNNINTNNNTNNKRKIGAPLPAGGGLVPLMKPENNNKNDQDGYIFLPQGSAFNTTAKTITPEDAQLLIAQQMNSLTVNERQKAYEDLHAVSQIIEETPEFVAEKTEQLQQELNKIKRKRAYEKALKQGPKYVDTRRFNLMFLRATHFDAREAAHRIVCHFEEKVCWFGESALGRPIVLNDLSADDKKLINSGFYQVLPARDRAGRRILWTTPLGKIKVSVESLARVLWYLLMTLFEFDNETQIRGLVGVVSIGEFELNQAEKSYGYVASRLVLALPHRVAGLHFCAKDIKMASFASLFIFVLGHFVNSRCRVHYGSDTEIQYTLMTFGINHEVLPLTSSGGIKLKYHKEWLERQQLREEMFPYLLYDQQEHNVVNEQTIIPKNNNVGRSSNIVVIDLPGHYDVMLGRGKPFQKHFGNIQLMELIESVRDELDKAPRGKKQKIQQEKILKKIQSMGGCFLKQQKEGWWIQVSNEVALDKISHAYRNVSPRNKKK